jgi:pimeloyl-ACP methyl ester carboxylesterase
MARLGFDTTIGITNVVEHIHHAIGDRVVPFANPIVGCVRRVTEAVYYTIRGTTWLAAEGVDAALRVVEPATRSSRVSPEREAALAAINGVWGDHLQASANPLAIRSTLRVQGRPLALTRQGLQSALPDATGRIAVLAHGLCMNDLQWQRNGHDHGAMLASELGYTVVRLHYNSGLHISTNGLRFAALLERLVAHWPVPVDELVIVGHSMGGLIARSACHKARVRSLAWLERLSRLVCLGAPHHGAMLERGGHLLVTLFEASPYVAPFARLGHARSAGITDLRYGNVQRADWVGRHPHDQKHDDRTPTPLPAGVAVYLLAATQAELPRGMRHALIGDGLVTLASAWGEHRDHALALAVPASHKALITRANHWDLLSHPEAADVLRRWLA